MVFPFSFLFLALKTEIRVSPLMHTPTTKMQKTGKKHSAPLVLPFGKEKRSSVTFLLLFLLFFFFFVPSVFGNRCCIRKRGRGKNAGEKGDHTFAFAEFSTARIRHHNLPMKSALHARLEVEKKKAKRGSTPSRERHADALLRYVP